MKPKFVTVVLLGLMFLNLALMGTMGIERFNWTNQLDRIEHSLMTLIEVQTTVNGNQKK